MPPVPVIVTVAAPRVAVLDAESVRVLEPVVEAGLKTVVTPVGNPLALRATLPLKPPDGVSVMTLVTVDPWLTETLAGAAASEKSPPAPVTVRAIVTVWLSVPLVPVMVTFAGPVAAVADAVKVTTLPAKLAVTPVGRPLAAKVTAPLNPLIGVTVMVLVDVPP